MAAPFGCSLASLISSKTKPRSKKGWSVGTADGQDLRDGLEESHGLCQRESTQQLEGALSWSHCVTLKKAAENHLAKFFLYP